MDCKDPEQTVRLPAGYRLRTPHSDDAEAVAALRRTVDIDHYGESDATEAQVIEEWALPRASLDDDIWLLETDAGELAGYGFVWYENPPREAVMEQIIHPSHRGRGLSEVLLALGEARARRHPLRAPGGRPEPVSIDVWFPETDTARLALVSRHGYRHVRTFARLEARIDRRLATPCWPRGIVARGFRRDRDEAAVHAATEEAFRDHYRPTAMDLEEWLAYRFERPDLDPGLWWVAWAGDQVAGSLLAFETPMGGYIDELSVRRPWRRAGLGRALLLHAFAELQQRGQALAYLGVDTINPTGAMQLYESIGMHRRRPPMLVFEKELPAT